MRVVKPLAASRPKPVKAQRVVVDNWVPFVAPAVAPENVQAASKELMLRVLDIVMRKDPKKIFYRPVTEQMVRRALLRCCYAVYGLWF